MAVVVVVAEIELELGVEDGMDGALDAVVVGVPRDDWLGQEVVLRRRRADEPLHRAGIPRIRAGLRTPDKWIPYPEEMNRRVIDTIADELYSPTVKSAKALKREGIKKNIYITGNTVIDALFYARKKVRSGAKVSKIISDLPDGRTILVTAHRRESWGGDLEEIARALVDIAESFPRYKIYFPIHLNPIVRRFGEKGQYHFMIQTINCRNVLM